MAGPYVTPAGARAANEMFGEGGNELMERNARRWAERVDDSWARIINGWIINGCYARGVLPTATRELCAVAALTALGATEELDAHIRIALNSNSPEHVREVILQMGVYGGMPVALAGLRAFERITAEEAYDPE
jgi:4-carboxymuconolactone decarboxylase